MLMHYGIVDRYPSGAPNEKLICLKNNYKISIYNGMDMTISKRIEENHIDRWFKAYFGHPLPHKIYMGHFDDTVNHAKYRLYQDAKIRKKLVEMDWAYAVTVHKAQG